MKFWINIYIFKMIEKDITNIRVECEMQAGREAASDIASMEINVFVTL